MFLFLVSPATGPHEYTNGILQFQKFTHSLLGNLAPMLPGECVEQTTHPLHAGGACNNFDGL